MTNAIVTFIIVTVVLLGLGGLFGWLGTGEVLIVLLLALGITVAVGRLRRRKTEIA
jgi:hypothetical protein